jgi:hypothetical protein
MARPDDARVSRAESVRARGEIPWAYSADCLATTLAARRVHARWLPIYRVVQPVSLGPLRAYALQKNSFRLLATLM